MTSSRSSNKTFSYSPSPFSGRGLFTFRPTGGGILITATTSDNYCDNKTSMTKTKKLFLTAAVMLLSASGIHATTADDIKPVPFTNVNITDQFWSQRLKTLRNTTIRYAFKKCDDAGQIRNFEYAGKIVSGEAKVGDLTFQSGQPYDDAEVYKVLEGASYLLKVEKDADLEAYCDEVIDKICSAQEPDGYLQTNFTIHNPLHSWYNGEKWTSDWNLSHETFNVGELIECAVAYYQATGKDKLLKCAIKAADNMCDVFKEGGVKMAPGHAVVEMALVRLYELTGNEKYLNECKFFLDCRGIRKFDPTSNDQRVNGKYWQDHLPAIEQRTAEGHAVRALYFYSGMADWVRYSGDQDYQTAIDAIWNNIASKKFYITGGFGARDNNEAFGEDYELPNATAYCETCASVAGVMFNERMFRLHGESKYIDMLERALYNTVLDGLSIQGTSFYYPNRLEVSSRGNERSEWFGTSCCPTNLCRLIPSVPGYVYATNDKSLYVNLFVNSDATMTVGNYDMAVKQTTSYPYSGNIKMTVTLTDNGSAATQMSDIRIRIPGWAVNEPVASDLYSFVNPTTTPTVIKINGQEYAYSVVNGYAVIPVEEVKKGDIEVILPMDIHQVVSNENLKGNTGLRSYERGPLVYCAEGVDNDDALSNVYIPENTTYKTATLLATTFNGGVTSITTPAVKVENNGGEVIKTDTKVRLIPYFARAHRTPCSMKVWISMDESTLESSIEYIDKVQPCDDADEKAHNLNGSNMRTGADLGWRDSDGGYISYDMTIDPDRPNDLIMKLWGSDSGNRNFDIYINGNKVAYEEVENFMPGQYYYMRHAMPFDLTEGKTKVTVKLQSINGSTVGGIFGVYTGVSENAPSGTVPMDYMWTGRYQYLKQHSYKGDYDTSLFRNRHCADGTGEEGQSWTMAVNPTNRNYLMIYYWGDESDARDFDIYCDDTFVDKEHLQNNEPGRFFFRTYIIPEEGTSGKDKVTIRLCSQSGTKTGGVYYAYMMSEPIVDGIAETEATEEGEPRFFSLSGVETQCPMPGINIVQRGNKVTKIAVK